MKKGAMNVKEAGEGCMGELGGEKKQDTYL